MIWLRKRQDDQVTDGKDYVFENEMELFNDYLKRNMDALLTEDLERDIIFHLYQLIDIYFRCVIVYSYLQITNKKEKDEYIKSFADIENIDKYVSFDKFFPSEEMDFNREEKKELVNKIFLEVKQTFVEDYKDTIKCYEKKIFKQKNGKIIVLSILGIGLFANLNIYSSLHYKNLKLKNKGNGSIIELPDFFKNFVYERVPINNDLYNLIKITDLSEFLKQKCIQSFKHYFELAELYFAKKDEEILLSKKCFVFEKIEDEQKKQFLSLLKDENFVEINNICDVFIDYCYILIKTKTIKYENNGLRSVNKKSWGTYYPGCFVHDVNLKLNDVSSKIRKPFMSLFCLKKDKDYSNKAQSDGTYTGYKNLSKILIQKLEDLDSMRKKLKK